MPWTEEKTMHEAICDVPVKKDIVCISTEQEQNVTAIQDVQPQSDEHIKEIKAPLVGTFYTAKQVLMRNLLSKTRAERSCR